VNDLANELSRKGLQYGIHADGSVVLFAGERRFPIGDGKMLKPVETAYRAEIAKLDQRYERLVDGRELKFERVRAVSPFSRLKKRGEVRA
jgi:hypothetical protein